MAKFLKTPLVMSFLAEAFGGDRKCFSDRGCRRFHVSPETRKKV